MNKLFLTLLLISIGWGCTALPPADPPEPLPYERSPRPAETPLISMAQEMAEAYEAKAQREEISIFNSEGATIAYIDTDDLTIYLWNGKPVAYLSNGNNNFHIYGFNGKHLGWLVDGIIRDHQGDVVGFKKGAINIYTAYEPYKGYKQYKPYKSPKEYAPYIPYLSNSWSNTPLILFLAQGIDD